MKLDVKDLCKSFDKPVIKNFSYRFESGKLYVIKGVSGCGKTTLLNILGGIISEYGGTILCDDAEEISHPGYIFQNSLLLSKISVYDNLRLIYPDDEKIVRYCHMLGVDNLLERFPEQLSGGERQRVAAVRSILNDPFLLLADEPTASLDSENSACMASLLASLRNEKRIIIVATHEHYFDEYADQILYLDYGRLGRVEYAEYPKRAVDNLRLTAVIGEERRDADIPQKEADYCHGKRIGIHKIQADLKYIYKRNPKKFSIPSLMPLAFAILILLLISSVQNNMAGEAMGFYTETYPTSILLLPEEMLGQFKHEDELEIFDYYIAEEDEITAYYRMPEEYSVLHIPGIITIGQFPGKPEEILISRALAERLAGENELTEVVGTEIVFKGCTFTVTGIIENTDSFFRYDYYYCYNKDGRPFGTDELFILMDYDILSRIGEKRDNAVVMCIAYDLYYNTELQEKLKNAGVDSFNQFFANAETLQQQVNFYSRIMYIVIVVLFILCCFFVTSILRTDLFYRRRELGYLQIFGLSAKRVSRLIKGEYYIKFGQAALIAFILHLIIIMIYRIVLGSFVWPNFPDVALVVGALFGIYGVTVSHTVSRYLKTPLIDLIH